MWNKKRSNILLFVLSLSFYACTNTKNFRSAIPYSPGAKELYDSIVYMDSVLFASYNNCDLVSFASMVSEDIEFYHDKAGLMTAKKDILTAVKNNICGKVTRELVKGSIEVYAIVGYGAVEMGQHFFINNREPKPKQPAIGKFVHLWKKENSSWKLTRVISLH